MFKLPVASVHSHKPFEVHSRPTSHHRPSHGTPTTLPVSVPLVILRGSSAEGRREGGSSAEGRREGGEHKHHKHKKHKKHKKHRHPDQEQVVMETQLTPAFPPTRLPVTVQESVPVSVRPVPPAIPPTEHHSHKHKHHKHHHSSPHRHHKKTHTVFEATGVVDGGGHMVQRLPAPVPQVSGKPLFVQRERQGLGTATKIHGSKPEANMLRQWGQPPSLVGGEGERHKTHKKKKKKHKHRHHPSTEQHSLLDAAEPSPPLQKPLSLLPQKSFPSPPQKPLSPLQGGRMDVDYDVSREIPPSPKQAKFDESPHIEKPVVDVSRPLSPKRTPRVPPQEKQHSQLALKAPPSSITPSPLPPSPSHIPTPLAHEGHAHHIQRPPQTQGRICILMD